MKRIVSMLLIAVILMQSASDAFANRTIISISEKIIPFSFVSENQFLEEDLSIKGLADVKIKDIYVDNGEMTAKVDGDWVEVDFSEGEWANSYKTINKVRSLVIDNAVLTHEDKKTIIISPDNDVKSIQAVSGDFGSAKVNSNGDIEISVENNSKEV